MVKIYIGTDMEVLKIKSKEEIKNILGSLDSFNYAEFSMYNDFIQDAVEFVSNVSFTSDKKAALVSDCYFLSLDEMAAPSSFNSQQDFSALEKYIDTPNPDSDLVLLMTGRMKGEKGNSLIAALKKHAQIIDLGSLTTQDMMEAGLRYVGERKATIDKDSLYELIKRCKEDYMLFLRSLDKLLCYTNDIRIEDVEDLVAPELEDNVFAIVEPLFRNNPGEAIRTYRDLEKSGIDLMRLLPVFASQFRFMYEVAYLSEKKINDIDASKELKCNPMRVKYARRSLGSIRKENVMQMMADLGKIEEHLKFDLDDPDTALEMYIINFRRNYLVNKQ